MKSGNHAAAKKQDGEWACDACGAEAVDFELFEEVGSTERCLERNPELGASILEENRAQWDENLGKITERVVEIRQSMERMNEAMRKANEQLEKIKELP